MVMEICRLRRNFRGRNLVSPSISLASESNLPKVEKRNQVSFEILNMKFGILWLGGG